MADKITQWRLEGMGYALKAIEDHGLEEFKKELAYRQKAGISAMVTSKDLRQLHDLITEDALKVALVFSVYALRDEFNFGHERMQRFVRRYEEKAEAFTKGYYTFDELRQMLLDETGFEVCFR